MSNYFDAASLSIVLSGADHSSADVALLIESVDALVAASLWASISDPEATDKRLINARSILTRSLEDSKAGSRFYPSFYTILQRPEALPFNQPLAEDNLPPSESDRDFEIANPIDVGTLVGVNSWMRRQLLVESPTLYRDLFGFASIQRLEHNSPLLLELGIVLGAAITVPVLLTYGLMRAVARAKRQNIEAEIREVELEEKRLALKQRQIQTLMLEEVADAFHRERERNPDYRLPENVVATAVQIAAPAVADLGSSALIEKVTFGASLGGKSS